MSVGKMLFKGSRILKTPVPPLSGERGSASRYFELALTMRGITQGLSEISSKLALMSVQILSGVHTRLEDEFLWRFLIEVPESVSIERVSDSLSRLGSVLEVKWTEINKPFDKLFFPVHFYGDRVVFFTSSMFHAMIKEVSDLVTEAGEEILFYRKGAAMASVLYERFLRYLRSVDDKLAFMEDLLRAFGWCTIEFLKVKPGGRVSSIKVYESMESSSPAKVKCHFLRGFLTEILRRVYGDFFIDLEECKCRSMGDQYCEFKVK
ncbi:hypothetical protein J7L06_11040 [Candidatus Bathyarchaeota archaeon]|nr:hypothetical protein [Candidatus Bathyarchaeota archaeon]